MQDRLQKLWTSDGVHKEGTAEYLLSDYEEDIKRVLYTDVRHTPSASYTDGGECVCIGSVEYHVVYQSTSGRVSGVRFSSEYELPLSLAEEMAKGEGRVELMSSSVRPISSRKLMGKYALVARYHAVIEESALPGGDAIGREGTVTLPAEVHASHYDTASTDEREYAEELCRSAIEGTYLFSEADCKVEKVTEASGGVIVAGAITVRSLVEREGEGVSVVEKRIPFEEFVVCDGELDSCEAVGRGSISSLTVTQRHEEDVYVAVVSLICRFTVHRLGHGSATMIRDLYSTAYETKVEYSDRECVMEERLCRMIFPLEARMARAELESPEIEEILLLHPEMRMNSMNVADGRVTCSGELCCNMLGRCTAEDGLAAYAKNAVRMGVDTMAALAQAKEGMTLTPIAIVPRCRAYMDAEELIVEGELEMLAYLTRYKIMRTVRNAEVQDTLKKELLADEVWILYPQTSLWEIAKQNHLSPRKICDDNNLQYDESSLDNMESLSAVSHLWIEE